MLVSLLILIALLIVLMVAKSAMNANLGGGHICKRCGRLTYANDDECGWCDGDDFD